MARTGRPKVDDPANARVTVRFKEKEYKKEGYFILGKTSGGISFFECLALRYKRRFKGSSNHHGI